MRSTLAFLGIYAFAASISGAQIAHRKHFRRVATLLPLAAPAAFTTAGVATAHVDLTHVLNTFSPLKAFGGALDSVGGGSLDSDFSALNESKILASGLGNISYRLYTELSVQAWHWNPVGTWSDSAHGQGYFVGSANLGSDIVHSYGYALPHRGSTFDQGDGLEYSRLDDGNPSTYWKSNPYLSSTYTHDSDSAHPQWIVIDLRSTRAVNALKIQWANPYAIDYDVQYWTGLDAIGDPVHGHWTEFPKGAIRGAIGGNVILKLTAQPISTQFVRILMTKGSNTFDTHGASDPRNKMGYAVFEVGLGLLDSHNSFTDFLSHRPDTQQSPIYVSSVDPWHQASSIVLANEQPGLDFVLKGDLTRKAAALVPVANVYGVPEDAVAEIAYLSKRSFPLLGVEIGEEADGQYMVPEDYAALYVQWARALHSSFPNLKIGGPVLSAPDAQTWSDSQGETDWMKRFIAYLTAHNAKNLLHFASVEHYPFSATTSDWSLLAQEPAYVTTLFNEIRTAVATNIPVYVTEYNFDALTSEVPVDEMGAIWHALFLGEFLDHGGRAAFYYQYLPLQLLTDGTVWGFTGLYGADANDQALYPAAQFFSTQMLAKEWCQLGAGIHTLFASDCTNPAIKVYGLVRPDGKYSVLLLNLDSGPHSTYVSFKTSTAQAFTGNVEVSAFSPSNYAWHAAGAGGYPKPDGPISHGAEGGNATAIYTLPGHSIVVLKGRIQ